MDKFQLLQVLKNGTASSDDTALAVIDLKRQFPFSQVVHVIAARISKDKGLPDQQTQLQQAAVYINDRSVLKEVMLRQVQSGDNLSLTKKEIQTESEQSQPQTSATVADVVPANPSESIVNIVQTSPEENKVAEITSSTDVAIRDAETENIINTIDFADVVIQDLHRLSELKHNFEMLFLEHNAKIVSDQKVAENEAKSKREKIVELAKAMSNEPSDLQTTAKGRKRRKDSHTDLIEEIEITKEEIIPENERQKEQIEIIDHFIKKQPSINSKERSVTPAADLNSIKSGEFGENIVSETLVEILIKQGKKERAIEVLKKLIWKYPQKKAYFASQIEDLKK